MKFRFIPLAAACAACLCAASAFARPPPPSQSPPPPPVHQAQAIRSAPVRPTTAQPARHLSLEQAVRQVQHQTQGHILAADSVSRGHNKVYRIKVLTPKGKVKVMQLHSNPTKPKSSSGGHDSDQGGH